MDVSEAVSAIGTAIGAVALVGVAYLNVRAVIFVYRSVVARMLS